MKSFITRLGLCLVLATVGCYGLPTTEVEVAEKNLTAQSLVDLGNAFNKTMLKLIGHALVNMDRDLRSQLCHVNPCAHWTVWTNCSASSPKTFGFQTRNRACWYDGTGACDKSGNATKENESRVCEGHCSTDYTITTHNLCLKINPTVVTQPEAEKQCLAEGGHLMNMDTQERRNDFVTMAKESGRDSIWIDGTRDVASGPWSFQSGTDPEDNGLDFWKGNEPSNGSSELCKVSEISSGTRYWWDRDCSSKYAFVCEIRT